MLAWTGGFGEKDIRLLHEASMDLDEMAAGDPRLPEEGDGNRMYADFVPHDLKYSPEFEDAVMRAVLGIDSSAPEGIRVIPEGSDEQAVPGVSVRSNDESIRNLSRMEEHLLPLPLDDSRRVFASAIPGIKLTHPSGYFHGGPGLDPELENLAQDVLNKNPRVSTLAQLRSALEKEIAANRELLEERMRARQRAIQKNEQIDRELKLLMEEHSMELKINRKLVDERRAKKEAKAKRRLEKDGG